MEAKTETDSNDAVEIKTEADSNDIADYPCDDGPSIGMFGFSDAVLTCLAYLHCYDGLSVTHGCLCQS